MELIVRLMLTGWVFAGIPDVVWERTVDLGVSDKAHGFALSPSEDALVVTGEVGDLPQDILVYKLSTETGDSIWAETYDNNGAEDIGSDVAVAPNGIIFIGATTRSGGDPKMFLCGFSSTGELLWTKPSSSPGPNSPPSLACRHSDSCYVAGWYNLGGNTHPKVLLLGADGSANLLWDTPAPSSYALTGVDIDSDGQIYLSSSSMVGVRLNKRSADGDYIWDASYPGGESAKGWQCKVAPTQEIFLCGEEFYDFLLLKWKPDGNLLWPEGKYYDLGADEFCRDLAVDAGTDSPSDCYLAGWQVRGTEEDIALIKTDSAGNLLWSWVDTLPGKQEIEAIEVDSDGYIWLAGSHYNGSNWDMLIMKVRQPLTISGKVTDSLGKPMKGITVALSGDTTVEAVTDDQGRYSLEVYNGGNYSLKPAIAGWVFEPASRTYTPLAHREFDQDFLNGHKSGIEESPVSIASQLDVDGSAISFTLPYQSFVRLALYDAAGREVALLAKEFYGTGDHRIPLPELEAGLYFVRLQAGHSTVTRKAVVVR